MSKKFFSDLVPLSEYSQMIEPEHYHALPADWLLLLTDVRGSTKAIEAGRYKEVNMIGVSCIVAVQNALVGIDFPYVFGGDGATLAVPGEFAAQAQEALAHTRKIAREQFGFELRIAVIKAKQILDTGAPLMVAKMRVSDGNHLALVRGSGWSAAESWMKERGAEFELAADYPSGGDHDGLECRWNPLKARKSEIMALIVQTRTSGAEGEKVYRDILREILATETKPIGLDNIQLAWPPKYLPHEARMREPRFFPRMVFLLKAYALLLVFSLMMWWRGERNQTDPFKYISELTTNTDYLKFDECLRMILDVSAEQKSALIARLEAHHKNGEIYYGMHCDPYALMTCFIQGPSKHMHFVDAGGGGYAMAAKQLKAQKRQT